MGTTHRSGQCVRQSVDESHLVSGPGTNRCHIAQVPCTSPPVFAPRRPKKTQERRREKTLSMPCDAPPPNPGLGNPLRFVLHLNFPSFPGRPGKERIVVSPNPKPLGFTFVRGLGFIGLKSSGALKRGVRIVNVVHKQQRFGTKYLEVSSTFYFIFIKVEELDDTVLRTCLPLATSSYPSYEMGY